ncbi:MAG: radical SAM protein, partial [Proteobacteria bacterium]|nr:radical SAM protein [Pseudomonadota bacterium]
AAFAHAGVNRVSLGVQDFDERVQKAIGREQGFELTRRSVDLFRDRGVGSVNIDLVYGLPHQTLTSLERTIDDVIALAPDRIAAFGYAHLPSRVPSQRLIETAALPGIHERFRQSSLIVELLEAGGYARVGLDHFARRADKLAAEPLRRNFQGYTSDAADALLGFGASAIGQLPGGFVQNAIPVNDYARRVAEHGVATAKGMALGDDDRVRAYAIERLMCDFRLSTQDLAARFGTAAAPVLADAARIVGADRDGLVMPTDDGFEMTELGKPFVRTICAGLDSYFGAKPATHSVAV